jgi:hypothetical protein
VSDTGRAAVITADAIARVCAEPDFYRGLVGGDAAHLVDAVLASALSSDLQDLRTALQALDEALYQVGHVVGVTGGTHRGPVVEGKTMFRPSERVFLCPQRCCSRYWLAADHVDEPVPACSVTGLPLRARNL